MRNSRIREMQITRLAASAIERIMTNSKPIWCNVDKWNNSHTQRRVVIIMWDHVFSLT